MKKVLSTALALGLVAGIASTAAAYDKFEISGYYSIDGNYIGNASKNGVGTGVDLGVDGVDQDASSAWFESDFRLYPTLTINDKTKIKAEIRLLSDSVWGHDTNHLATADGGVDIDKLYMQYDSPVGTVLIGRVPWGSYGYSKFGNSAGREDGIIWATNFLAKPYTLSLAYVKYDEADLADKDITDGDSDWYSVHLDYKTDTTVAGARLIYIDNAFTDTAVDGDRQHDDWRVQGYAKVNFDNLFVGTEITHKFGDYETDGGADMDDDSWAVMVEAGGKFDALDATLSYWYLSGDDDADDEDESFGLAGNDWQPLMIMTGEEAGVLNAKDGATVYNALASALGQHMIVASFGYTVDDKLSLNSAIGGGWLEEDAGGDDDLGWEVNVGAAYKLLDNLTYSLNFGYWDAGDAIVDNLNTEEDDVMMVKNTLNMTF